MNDMSQKHQYKADIRWSDEDQTYIAKVPELSGVVTHGDSLTEAAEMLEEAIAVHLRTLARHNIPAPKPIAAEKLNGKYPLRISRELHQDAVLKQRREGYKSLNEYLKHLIEVDVENDISPREMKKLTRETYIKGPGFKNRTTKIKTTRKTKRSTK